MYLNRQSALNWNRGPEVKVESSIVSHKRFSIHNCSPTTVCTDWRDMWFMIFYFMPLLSFTMAKVSSTFAKNKHNRTNESAESRLPKYASHPIFENYLYRSDFASVLPRTLRVRKPTVLGKWKRCLFRGRSAQCASDFDRDQGPLPHSFIRNRSIDIDNKQLLKGNLIESRVRADELIQWIEKNGKGPSHSQNIHHTEYQIK